MKETKNRSNHITGGRKNRRQRILMQRRLMLAGILLAVAVAVVLMVCYFLGVFDHSAKVSTLTLREDGTVMCEEVTDFDADYYDKSELKHFAQEEIAAYNEEYGSQAVKLKKLKVKDGSVYMRTEYADWTHYSRFNGVDMFLGTVAEAQEAGFDFSDSFVKVKDGAKGDSVSAEKILEDGSRQILVIRENITVALEKKIRYLSDESTTVTDAEHVTISQADGNEDATSLTYIIYEK